MKAVGFVLLPLICLALIGCSTSLMLDQEITRDDLDMGSALEAAGADKVLISYPCVYYDGQEFAKALAQMLEKAQSYIIIETFLGSLCDENQEIFDILAQKAEEGVKVYFINDGVGFFDMTESKYHLRPFYYLEDYGVQIHTVNPVSGNRLIGLTRMLDRDHRKTVVVDGLHVALGGMNLNYVSMNAHENGGQRDSMYIFSSPDLGKVLVEDFVQFWNDNDWREVEVEDFQPYTGSCPEATIDAYFFNQFGNKKDQMAKAYAVTLSHAKKTVDFLPYLPYTDSSMLKAIENASLDAQVTVLVPFDSRKGPRMGVQYNLLDLIENGATLYREKENDNSNGLLHEKLLIVDSRYSLIGSANYNYRSMNLSDEVALIVDDEDFALQMTAHFNELLESARPLSEEEAQSYKTLPGALRFAMVFFGG